MHPPSYNVQQDLLEAQSIRFRGVLVTRLFIFGVLLSIIFVVSNVALYRSKADQLLRHDSLYFGSEVKCEPATNTSNSVCDENHLCIVCAPVRLFNSGGYFHELYVPSLITIVISLFGLGWIMCMSFCEVCKEGTMGFGNDAVV